MNVVTYKATVWLVAITQPQFNFDFNYSCAHSLWAYT